MQCEHCCKFYATKKQLVRHEVKCTQLSSDRYKFPRVKGDLFCFKGCSKFKDESSLAQHLLWDHRERLRAWGINPLLLASQFKLRPSQDAVEDSDSSAQDELSEDSQVTPVTLKDLLEPTECAPSETPQGE